MYLVEYDASALTPGERYSISEQFDQSERFSTVRGIVINVFTDRPHELETPAGCRIILITGSPDDP